ncbi:unnamed protein product [Rotaria sp. Silwood1]|nr:unnamed protein product [Rotaria sp. Silwood1]CAF4635761.1 unnamed protein product [Rotaria sp. Silwood1]CAF4695536.1 unnamed protein product [Rotaria sp. Silwood1]
MIIRFYVEQKKVLFHIQTLHAFECYYCNDEQGYYCPQPFPTKSMFNNNEQYSKQIKNIAISSSNNPLMEPIKTNYYNKNYEYKNTYRGSIKRSMNDSIICNSNYRLSQNPNYPGWEKTYCCYHNRCNLSRTIIKDTNTIILLYIISILLIDL